ncbi:hypothetical protein [Leptothoe sp. PORK10 BA2]|nr:hypothetical protein [Leptothoe sp. PORK10 BA2]MEA5465289.1 hypothetical protein [Leptothoe sp. PORK10 BA2]
MPKLTVLRELWSNHDLNPLPVATATGIKRSPLGLPPGVAKADGTP